MQEIPLLMSIAFIIITLASVIIFYWAAHRSRITLFIIIGWMVVQAALSLNHFYESTSQTPMRILPLVVPSLMGILGLFITARGRKFLESLEPRALAAIHMVRIAVELCMLGWFLYGRVPRIMTFEGRNFDILAGIAALIIFLMLLKRKPVSQKVLIIFNLTGLLLLLNIVGIAILSAPLPFQRFGFEQPNVVIFIFPYNWLPSIIVPLVLLSHLAALKKLLGKSRKKEMKVIQQEIMV